MNFERNLRKILEMRDFERRKYIQINRLLILGITLLIGIFLGNVLLQNNISLTGHITGNLPDVGESNWGTILNNYLLQEHTVNGTHGNVTIEGSLNVSGNISTKSQPIVGGFPMAFTRVYVNTTPGTFNWTVPSGVYRIYVEVYGGGGSGAKDAGTSGGSGGAGGVVEGFVSVIPGENITITVGAGGASQTTVDNNGNPGGTSFVNNTFGNIMNATGGGGGGQTTAWGGGGSGGEGYGGDINYRGGQGGSGGGKSGGSNKRGQGYNRGGIGGNGSSGSVFGGGGSDSGSGDSGAGGDGGIIIWY